MAARAGAHVVRWHFVLRVAPLWHAVLKALERGLEAA